MRHAKYEKETQNLLTLRPANPQSDAERLTVLRLRAVNPASLQYAVARDGVSTDDIEISAERCAASRRHAAKHNGKAPHRNRCGAFRALTTHQKSGSLSS